MELDLDKVKVRYTVKEIVGIVGLILTLTTHGIRTEMEFQQVKESLAKCEQHVNELEAIHRAEIEEFKQCDKSNAGPPCVPRELKK